jgi:subtilase family serine protease
MPVARFAVLVGAVVATAVAITPAVASATPTGSATPVPQATGMQPVCAGAYVQLRCDAERVTTNGPARTAITGSGPIGWGAQDLRKAHQLPSTDSHSGTIAIIDVGADPSLESDLGVYRQQYGLPACTTANGCFQQMDYQGGPALPPATTTADKAVDEQIAEETSLDVDMAGAACPGCRLLEVQIPDSQLPTPPKDPSQPTDYDGYAQAFGTAVRTAVGHGASAVSMSYGLPGDAKMLTGTIASDLDHQGVAITASSGDSGFAGDEYAWPQALPTVTSVGGTELVEQDGSYVEGAWSSAGSGCAPGTADGQPATLSALCGNGRSDTDVSAVADDVAVYDSYAPASGIKLGWLVLAGTSASAPFIAGVYTAAGHLAGVHGPNTLYQAPSSAFHDVTSGANGAIGTSDGDCEAVSGVISGSGTTFPNRLCQARQGWDGPTGLGSPRGLPGF